MRGRSIRLPSMPHDRVLSITWQQPRHRKFPMGGVAANGSPFQARPSRSRCRTTDISAPRRTSLAFDDTKFLGGRRVPLPARPAVLLHESECDQRAIPASINLCIPVGGKHISVPSNARYARPPLPESARRLRSHPRPRRSSSGRWPDSTHGKYTHFQRLDVVDACLKVMRASLPRQESVSRRLCPRIGCLNHFFGP